MNALALSLCLLAAPQGAEAPADPFPPSTALAERISPEGLQGLSDLVQSFVDDGEVVGAELMVVVNDRTILHEGYGWRDREREVPMEPGGVFCVRSMTKPLIGTATWMLITERKLSLDDRVAEYLPAFDVEGKREITVEHLLTHTSGLPMSLILAQDPRKLESVRAVADLGGACELEFEPGTDFNYSDQGTDTLTAVVEVVSGMPAEDFLRERLLDPLGMSDTTCLMTADHPLRARGCGAYTGSPGSWSRYWSPQDEQLFPVFLGSQALYSTAVDYARYLDLYMHRGRANGERLLRASAVRRTLRPANDLGTTALPGASVGYGMLMQVWTREDEDGEPELVAFGHNGSDGTYAWAFPELDALVMYFTQSRGTPTGLRVEEHLGELLLGVPFDPLQAAPPLEEYLGYYWEGEGDLYRAIVRDGKDLALEILGRAVVPLDYIGDDRWKLRPQPATVIEFDRDEAGTVVGYHIGDHVEHRFTPRADLPSADEVAARVAATHRIDLLEGVGVVRMRGRLELPKLERSGEVVTWMEWPNRWRTDEAVAEEVGCVAYDGETVRSESVLRPAGPVEAEQAAMMLQRDPFVRFGDWRRDGATLTVVQEIRREDEHAVLVRLGDCSATAPTVYVDWTTGHVGGMDGLMHIDGMGRIGQKVRFREFQDVHGAMLPKRVEVQLANPLIGTIVSTVDSVEVGVQVPEGHFALAD